MISLYKIENTKIKPDDDYISVELRGLSTDERPTEFAEKKIDNGSTWISIDTGDVEIYDLENEKWHQI